MRPCGYSNDHAPKDVGINLLINHLGAKVSFVNATREIDSPEFTAPGFLKTLQILTDESKVCGNVLVELLIHPGRFCLRALNQSQRGLLGSS